VAKVITQAGLRKFGVNIWLTDMDMQCLAASPPISPLLKKYEKDCPELILQRSSQQAMPKEEEVNVPSVTRRGKRKTDSETKREEKKKKTTTTRTVVQSVELVVETKGKKKTKRKT
jgi:hypothetical protein